MHLRARAFLLTLSCAVLACGDPAATLAPSTVPDAPHRITNGTPTGNAYGGVGALLVDADGDRYLDGFCSGSLIAPGVFLTAAHCLEYPAGAQYYVTFAPSLLPYWEALDITPLLGELIEATATYQHPDFIGGKLPNGRDRLSETTDDLAVVLLPVGSTTGIEPLALPPAGYLDDLAAQAGLVRDPATLVGYGIGVLARGNRLTGVDGLRKSAVTTIRFLKDDVLGLASSAVKTGAGASCYGDSGGPAFLAHDPDLIIGVSFWTVSNCTSISLYTRVDTESARSFLDDFVTLP